MWWTCENNTSVLFCCHTIQLVVKGRDFFRHLIVHTGCVRWCWWVYTGGSKYVTHNKCVLFQEKCLSVNIKCRNEWLWKVRCLSPVLLQGQKRILWNCKSSNYGQMKWQTKLVEKQPPWHKTYWQYWHGGVSLKLINGFIAWGSLFFICEYFCKTLLVC